VRSTCNEPRSDRQAPPEQYRVTQQSATETPGNWRSIWQQKEPGIYVDIVSASRCSRRRTNMIRMRLAELHQAIEPPMSSELRDKTHGMIRTRSFDTRRQPSAGTCFPMARRIAVAWLLHQLRLASLRSPR